MYSGGLSIVNVYRSVAFYLQTVCNGYVNMCTKYDY